MYDAYDGGRSDGRGRCFSAAPPRPARRSSFRRYTEICLHRHRRRRFYIEWRYRPRCHFLLSLCSMIMVQPLIFLGIAAEIRMYGLASGADDMAQKIYRHCD